MRRLMVAVAVFLSAELVVGADDASHSFTSEFSVASGTSLEVGLMVGEMMIETASVDKVTVEVEAHCRAGADTKCYRRLEKLGAELVQEATGSQVRITGVSKRYHKMEIEAKVIVPEGSPLAVKMYAGELRVDGGGQDLDIRLKYGEVTVHQPLASTESVLADANFGDAQIYASTGDTNPRRPWLVGSRVTWDNGEGDATVTVKLSAGDATVYLD